jgi:membrane-bound lytic murein transglycosylase D
MFRAQKKFGAYDKIIEKYQNKRFGFASKNFYPEFLAAREISKHYQKYFPNLHVDKPIITDSFLLKGYADINDLAKKFNINTTQIKTLNPSLRRPIFSSQKYIPKHYQLKLPKGTIAKLAGTPAISYKKSQKRSRFYRVARGDTAGKIARMQRIKLRDLLDFNQLNRRAVIYVGQNLRIPAPGDQRLASLSPNINREKKRPRANPLPVHKQRVRPRSNVIKPGKKSTEINSTPHIAIAKSHQPEPPTTAPEISLVEQQEPIKPVAAQNQSHADAANRKTDTRLAMLKSHTTDWQTDTIPLLTSHKATSQVAQVDAIEQPAIVPRPQNIISINPEVLVGNFQIERVYKDKHGNKIGVVQIEESETLGHYADWLDIPTQRIRDLNHLTFHRQIKTHQKIKIPLGSIAKETFEERRYEFHKEISEDFFAAFKVTGVQTYTVKRGDNIWTITHDALDLPFWLMNKYNLGVNFESLHPGQKLLFPVVEKI